MKFTLSWLKDHLESTASLEDISKTLTMIGLEVEHIIDRSAALKAFTVAKILHAEKHPEADKLRVCKVQSDIGELQIVCGASNARAGITVVLAKEGTLIPANGMVIKKTKIRGVESNGMLCSAEELGLSGDSTGIIELPETAAIGESVVKVLGLDDPMLEIAITPNRADALGVRGIARDLAAAGLGTLKDLGKNTSPNPESRIPSPIQVTIVDEKKCPQFIGCAIKGVKNVESPDWLKKRLEAIGQKSISALVDITNYLTIDLGRPLHVFDAQKLNGNLTVRDAKTGENFKALDGKDYALKPGMTVIADNTGVLSLGGIMGGTSSGCSLETQDVFLEVALFDPVNVAQTGRELGIDSDARFRFERGVDPDFVETGAWIAIFLITTLCDGKVSELTFAGKTPNWQCSFVVRQARIAALGGVELPATKAEAILKSLGFHCAPHADGWMVSPPSWRGDIDGEADVIEEILRIHGYDHVPATPLPFAPKPAVNIAQERLSNARQALTQRSMLELCTWSFLPEAHAKQFGGAKSELKLLNPISADLDMMRPSLLPNLLEAVKKNSFRGFKNLALFETGLEFHDTTASGQHMVIAGVRAGYAPEHHYQDTLFQRKERTIDSFDAKTDALAALQALGLTKCDITTQVPSWYHPGRSGAFTLGKTILGYFGELHPALWPVFALESSIAMFEIYPDAVPLPRAKGKAKSSLKLSDFQAVERDFAFIVDSHITAAEMLKAIAQADKQLITDVALFDVYAGKGVEPGKKSVAIKVTLQAMDKTLSEADIAAVSQAIIGAAAKGFGGQLRQ